MKIIFTHLLLNENSPKKIKDKKKEAAQQSLVLDTCRGLRPQRNMSNNDDDDDNYLCFSLVTGPAGSCNFGTTFGMF